MDSEPLLSQVAAVDGYADPVNLTSMLQLTSNTSDGHRAAVVYPFDIFFQLQ